MQSHQQPLRELAKRKLAANKVPESAAKGVDALETLPYDDERRFEAFANSGIEESPADEDGALQSSLAATFGSGSVAETQQDASPDELTKKAAIKEHVKEILSWRGHNSEEAARFATPSPAKATAGVASDQPEESEHPDQVGEKAGEEEEESKKPEGTIEDSENSEIDEEDAGLPRDQRKPEAAMESVVEAETQAHMLSTLIYMHEQGLDLPGAISNLKDLVGANIEANFDCTGPAAPIVTRIKQFELKRRDRPEEPEEPEEAAPAKPKARAKAKGRGKGRARGRGGRGRGRSRGRAADPIHIEESDADEEEDEPEEEQEDEQDELPAEEPELDEQKEEQPAEEMEEQEEELPAEDDEEEEEEEEDEEQPMKRPAAPARAKAKAKPKAKAKSAAKDVKLDSKSPKKPVKVMENKNKQKKGSEQEEEKGKKKKGEQDEEKTTIKKKKGIKPEDVKEEKGETKIKKRKKAEIENEKETTKEVKKDETKIKQRKKAPEIENDKEPMEEVDPNMKKPAAAAKSFARRSCPVTSPACHRWNAIQSTFKSKVAGKIISMGGGLYAWEDFRVLEFFVFNGFKRLMS